MMGCEQSCVEELHGDIEGSMVVEVEVLLLTRMGTGLASGVGG